MIGHTARRKFTIFRFLRRKNGRCDHRRGRRTSSLGQRQRGACWPQQYCHSYYKHQENCRAGRCKHMLPSMRTKPRALGGLTARYPFADKRIKLGTGDDPLQLRNSNARTSNRGPADGIEGLVIDISLPAHSGNSDDYPSPAVTKTFSALYATPCGPASCGPLHLLRKHRAAGRSRRRSSPRDRTSRATPGLLV